MPRTDKHFTWSERLPVFEQRLKLLMKEHRLTARHIAKEMGVHETAISHWRVGRAVPCVGRMMQLARIFSVDLHYLSGWSEKRPDLQLAKVATALERTLRDVQPELGAVKRRRKAAAL